ncbi:MAG: DUF2341 domain-containing protein [Thermosphaera sp.]
MPTPPLLHAIGTGFIIALLVGLFMYGLFMTEITMINNYTAILQYIADRVAASIRALYSSTYLMSANKSSISLNLPVEISSEKGYNVYIGKGFALAREFPRLQERSDYDPHAFYVIASTPDKKIYGVSLLFQPSDLSYPLILAKGEFVVERIREGFDPSEGYAEEGVLWLCRMPLNIKERAGVSLSSYLVKVEFNPSTINCSYLDSTFYPRREDVRFADSDGVSTLRYWIEEWSPNYTRIWVEIPSLSPLENKTIYLYWGNPNAQERSTTSIFLFYDEFSKYESLGDLLAINPVWNIRPHNASNYNLTPYQDGGLLTSSLDIKNKGFLILYYNRIIPIGLSQGLLIESLGRPLNSSSKDAEYLLGLVNVGDPSQVFNVSVQPVIADPSISLVNYTIIYGNWSIDSLGNDTFLNLTLLEPVGDIGYYGMALRSNPVPRNFPPGQEYFQVLYKVRIDNTSVIRGILISEDLDRNKAFYIGLQYDPTQNLLKMLSTNKTLTPTPSDFQVLNTTIMNIERPLWLILYVSVKSPGTANPEASFQVINPDNGSTVLSYSGRGTISVYQPNYLGPFAYSPTPIENEVQLWFDDLLSCRYSGQESFDIRKLFITGLPPDWEVVVIDYKDVEVIEENETRIERRPVFSTSAISDQYGTAIFDITLYPILGEKYPVEFLFYYNGELVDRVEYNGLISGGMVLVYRPYLKNPSSIDGGLIFTAGHPSLSYFIKPPASNPQQASRIVGHNITSIGYFNNTIYYFIRTPLLYNTTFTTSYNYDKPASNFTFFIGLMIYDSTGQGTENLAGLYTWIRARPFVDPEPIVEISRLPESLSIPRPPDVRISEYVDLIVFSSELFVDFFMVIRSDSYYVLTIVFKGKRA